MAPTLDNGERIIFNKFSYLVGEPNRGDIVIIQRPHKNYVKRVIALPGETIEIINHDLYINKVKYDQTFITEEAQKHTGNFGPIEMPEKSYFIMGDNRSISKDSQNSLGIIESKNINVYSELITYHFTECKITK